MRARYPDEAGYVQRDGVRIRWERFGDGSPTVLFLPTWSLVHSRCWKAQVPYFARHFRVLTFDPRGNGGSDRPRGRDAYAESEFASDALAVMDASGTENAVLVGWSKGAQRELLLAAEHPERVLGTVFIGPALSLSPVSPERARAFAAFTERRDSHDGWEKWNAEFWRDDLPGFLRFFLGEMFCEPHSTKQIEDGIAWGLETDAETLIATMLAPAPNAREEVLELCARVACPVLVIHGDRDEMRPLEVGRQLAEATGGRFVPLAGVGHGPHLRKPVLVNAMVRDFVEAAARPPPTGVSGLASPNLERTRP